jgi:DNA (cytosine-5)-methyltransferase 1
MRGHADGPIGKRGRPLLAVDLFAGAGGVTLGLRQAGFHVAAAIDIDSLAAETYRMNHPTTQLLEQDLREVDLEAFSRIALGRRHSLDLLAACPPCQGFSSMRTLRSRVAVKDDRNRLIKQVIRFVEALDPRVVLFENVPAVAKDWRFSDLCSGLRRRGYSVEYSVRDAADYGVPQRRRRLLMVAARGTEMPLLSDPRRHRATVRQAISAMPRVGESGDPLHDYFEQRSPKVARFIASVPKDGGSRKDLPPQRQLNCHLRLDGFYDVYGRMKWDAVAPTITGSCINPSKGRFLHPEEDRAVTLREAALLQSFPKYYWFSLKRGRYAAAQMIGNAFPPLVVEHHARELVRHAFR